jgi:hypothetical protein
MRRTAKWSPLNNLDIETGIVQDQSRHAQEGAMFYHSERRAVRHWGI